MLRTFVATILYRGKLGDILMASYLTLPPFLVFESANIYVLDRLSNAQGKKGSWGEIPNFTDFVFSFTNYL